MKVKPIGPFQVMEKDGNTYKLKDIGMSKNPLVLSSIVWVYCKDELIEGKIYKEKFLKIWIVYKYNLLLQHY